MYIIHQMKVYFWPQAVCLPNIMGLDQNYMHTVHTTFPVKDVPGGFPKSDLLGVTVALIHVAAQRFLAVLALWL